MSQQPGSDPPAIALFDLIVSQRVTAVIYVAARLGIADSLAEGPRTSRELARKTGAHERSILRLLRAMVAIGVCKQIGDQQFELTAIGKHLASSTEQPLKAWALFEGEWLWRSWGSLIESVRTGKTTAQLSGLDDRFEQMGQDPEAVKIFNESMASYTRIVVPAVLAAYDFSGIGKLYDVGGGYGELLSAILKAYPLMHGAVFDLPRCAEGAKKNLAEAGVSERGEFVDGSFFDSVPRGADAVILKSIIHDWDDERSITILRNCRQALPEAGKLLLIERIMPATVEATPEHLSVVLSDLNMLRGPGGCERTESEYRDLLGRTGFRMTRVVAAGRANVIEATFA